MKREFLWWLAEGACLFLVPLLSVPLGVMLWRMITVAEGAPALGAFVGLAVGAELFVFLSWLGRDMAQLCRR